MKRIGLWIGYVLFWLAWPAYQVYYRRSSRTRVLLTCGSDMLVLQGWINDGTFILPGGGMHTGEDPVTGAVRETLEETGLRILPEALVYLGEATYRRAGLQFTYHMFTASADAALALKRQRHEVADIRWVPIAAPGVRLSQDTQQTLQAARDHHLLQ